MAQAERDVIVTNFRNKIYVKVPGGEIQIGKVTGSVVAWIDGECVVLRQAKIT